MRLFDSTPGKRVTFGLVPGYLLMHDEDTRSLVLRTLEGDDAAFGELVRRYEGSAMRLAMAITRNPSDAEDAVQEAFWRAYKALPRFDPARPFGPWLLKITANRALTRARRRRPEAPLEEALAVPEAGRAEDRGPDLERLKQALGALSPGDRAVLSLRYDQDLPLSDIARTIGLKLGAVKVRLFRARERLLKLLKGGAA
jgi:RNA polymerase sigma-70 factor (ECF subfamily)